MVCGHLGPPSPRFGKNENAVTWDFRSQVRKVPGDRNFKKVEPGTVFQMTENDFFAKTRADTIPLMLPLFFMDDYGDNETLLFFMMMNLGKTNASTHSWSMFRVKWRKGSLILLCFALQFDFFFLF